MKNIITNALSSINRAAFWLIALAVCVLPSLAHATGTDVDTAVTTALGDGATKAGNYMGLAVAIVVVFFLFKLGKRALGRS